MGMGPGPLGEKAMGRRRLASRGLGAPRRRLEVERGTLEIRAVLIPV